MLSFYIVIYWSATCILNIILYQYNYLFTFSQRINDMHIFGSAVGSLYYFNLQLVSSDS